MTAVKKKHYKTKVGVIERMYRGQVSSSRKRGYALPSYTMEELVEAVISMPLFHDLHHKWKSSGYISELAPSLDRDDDYLPYTEDNITLMTWGENRDKGHKDRREGRNNKYNKAVKQYNLDGTFLNEYHSIQEADRQTKIPNQNIVKCCKGKRKTAGKFIWKYV